uniref:Uncharacterized protein LOC117361581 n=1 Tax=Geotrypetes seraphini TaxID=260995 RepID=A0A6P8RJ67_GEOSA|nr:uncharacterized protein LOC117361581 [Geotrypetes seraphini]
MYVITSYNLLLKLTTINRLQSTDDRHLQSLYLPGIAPSQVTTINRRQTSSVFSCQGSHPRRYWFKVEGRLQFLRVSLIYFQVYRYIGIPLLLPAYDNIPPTHCPTCCAPLLRPTRDCGTNPAPPTTPVAAITIVAHAATNIDPLPTSVTAEDIHTAVATILAGVQHMQDFAEESVRTICDVTGALQILLAALCGAPPTPPTREWLPLLPRELHPLVTTPPTPSSSPCLTPSPSCP